MGTKKRIIIVFVVVGAAVICGGLFGIYKYFVTPERVIALSLMNVSEKLDSVFDHAEKTDIDIFRDYMKNGGKLTISGESVNSQLFDGMTVDITVNSDGSCSVADIALYDKMDFKVYKDDEQLLVETPLFNGGFSVPVSNFAEEWNSSIFGNIVQAPDKYSATSIARRALKGDYSLSEFISSYKDDLKTALNEVEFKENGRVNVIINNDTERANAYGAHLNRNAAEKFVSAAADYICKTDGADSEAYQKIMGSFAVPEEGIDIVFKVKDLLLRELEIIIEDNKYTLALTGESEPFDDITVYKNDDTVNAVRRSVNGSDGVFTDNISVGGTTVFTVEGSADGYDVRYSMDDMTFDLSAHGKTAVDGSLSFSDVMINVNDVFELDGSLTVSNEYDDDFGFTKSGEYIDLLNMTEDEWEAVSGTMMAALGLMDIGN